MGLEVIWAMAAGSNYHGTVDAWQAGNYTASANQINLMSAAHSIYFTDMRLELGSVANDYEDPPFALELQRCQRYYCKSYDIETTPGTVTSAGSVLLICGRAATQFYCEYPWPVRMRAVPSVSVWGSSTGGANTIQGVDSANLTYSSDVYAYSQRGIRAIGTTAAMVLHDRYTFQWAADAEL